MQPVSGLLLNIHLGLRGSRGVGWGAVADREKVRGRTLTLLLPESLRLPLERLLMRCAAQIWMELNRSAAAKPVGWLVCEEVGPCREGRGPLRQLSIPCDACAGKPRHG